MREMLLFLTIASYLSFISTAGAECIYQMPRFVEMSVESCSSASQLAQSAVEGKGYSEWQKASVDASAKYLFIIRAKQLADVDIMEWYSRGQIHRYKGPQTPIKGDVPRDYLVIAQGGCEQLTTTSPLLFNVHAEKPCRDSLAIVNGEEAKETDARLLIELPEVSYFPDQGTLQTLEDAIKRLQVMCETHAPEA